MLCSAYDLGWVDDPDEVLVEMPLDFMSGDPCPAQMPAGVRPLSCKDCAWALATLVGLSKHMQRSCLAWLGMPCLMHCEH